MDDIKNSAVLEQMIAYAKKLGSPASSTLTAERFMITVFDVMNGTMTVDDAALATKLSNLIQNSPFDASRDRSALITFVGDAKKVSFMEGIYMQKKLMEAKNQAQKDNLPEITPDILLQKIIEEPTEGLRKCYTSDDEEKARKAANDQQIASLLKQAAAGQSTAGQKKAERDAAAAAPKSPKEARQLVANLTQKAKDTQKILLDSVFGQDNAVSVFTAGYFQSELLSLTDKKRTRPKAIFLFAGPPGVGKTFLAEKAAETLGLPFKRFDMSEYSDDESNIEFCGSDKVYKNGKAGNVTSFVADNPKCILLFDEIEKAHLTVIHLFLQILDAGRIRDNYTDEEVSFTDAIMIFTTNAGRSLYQDSETGNYSGVSKKMILKALENDKNPLTQEPFFPGAILSRFATANVVMFNHMAAHNLHQVVEKEVMRHARNYENEVGVSVGFDDRVFSSIIFSEGGAADARTVRSRAETFFDDELYELFRLIASDKTKGNIEDVEHIEFVVDLPKDDPDIMKLFEGESDDNVLVFTSDKVMAECDVEIRGCKLIHASTIEDAKRILHDTDIKFVLLDMGYGVKDDTCKFLNAEDVESLARDCFWYLKEYYRDLPVYLLETNGVGINVEEKLSFLRAGVRDVIALSDIKDDFKAKVREISNQLYQQESMNTLAKTNRMISFETAQTISEDHKTAEIRLFDFEMKLALEASDSKNILSNVSKPDIRFSDVIGAEDAKKELKYFVEYLKDPKKYAGTGLKAPRGVLLYGPPGTGKTMLAKAMAGESNVTFLAAEGNQFIQKYIGEGKERLHELFKTARKYAPSIIFVDEIEAVAKERRGGEHATANGEDVLTAFLTNMDGFNNDPSRPVFVLAATNFDVTPGSGRSLDAALMRRFDRKILIDLPNKDERIQYMRKKLASSPAFEISDEMIDNMAIRSTGMSLAELENVFEFALRSVVRDGGLKVTDAVLEEAFETYNSGEEKKWSEDLILRVARHEAGHALLCWMSGELPSYLTIVARGNHGGYMQHGDNEGKALHTKDEKLARIRCSMGGRAAEVVYYGERDGVSTGPSGDLKNATAIAQQMICTYGMYEEFGLATINYETASSGELADEVREAVNGILKAELENAIKIISENKEAIDALVDTLMVKNHMLGEEIDAILKAHVKK